MPRIPGERTTHLTHSANALLLPPAQEIVRCDERGSLSTSGEACRCKVCALYSLQDLDPRLTVAKGEESLPSLVPWRVNAGLA